MGCPNAIKSITWKDVLKLIVPFGWGVTSLAAVVAYGASYEISSTVFSFCSFAICAILFYDIWKYHRDNSYVALKSEQANTQWTTLKLCFAVAFAVLTGFGVFITIGFSTRIQIFGWSGPVWLLITCVLTVIWAIDIFKYHLKRTPQETPSADGQRESSAEMGTREETQLE